MREDRIRAKGAVSFSQISYDRAAWCTSISSGLIVPRPAGIGPPDLSYARSKIQSVSFILLRGILSWDRRAAVRIGVELTRRSVSWREFSKVFLSSSPYEILPGPDALFASCRAVSRVLLRIRILLLSLEKRWTSALEAPPAPRTSIRLLLGSKP